MLSPEIIKHDPMEFGGFQAAMFSIRDVQRRMCCATFCGDSGNRQIPVPGGYRIVCGRHAVIHLLVTLAILGESSPTAEARGLAEALGVDWERIVNTEPRHPTTPESFTCTNCGGGLIVETVGMYSGKRYIHTCGS